MRVGNAPRVGCGCCAWWRRGVGDDGMPRDCARCECGRGVSLCLRVVLFAGGCAPCFWRGVLLRLSRCARSAVCLSAVSCSVACCWFVAVCFVCRLLCGVRFVSAPAPTVTWFMQVCAGVHLTATVVVVYCLPCNGRFQRFALPTGMPVVFVSVSCRHKGWWGESGVRGRWRLVARRTT